MGEDSRLCEEGYEVTKYLFLVPREEANEWMLLSKDGCILTTTDPTDKAPRIVFSEKTSVPNVDWTELLENDD